MPTIGTKTLTTRIEYEKARGYMSLAKEMGTSASALLGEAVDDMLSGRNVKYVLMDNGYTRTEAEAIIERLIAQIEGK